MQRISIVCLRDVTKGFENQELHQHVYMQMTLKVISVRVNNVTVNILTPTKFYLEAVPTKDHISHILYFIL